MLKKTGSRYPEEFKAEAVQLAYSSPEKSIRQLFYELTCPRAMTQADLTDVLDDALLRRGGAPPLPFRTVNIPGAIAGRYSTGPPQ